MSPRFLPCAALALALCAFSSPSSLAVKPAEDEEETPNELPGVNPYTAPAIDELFSDLDELKPLPFDAVKRPIPQPTHASREQKGMIFGSLVADGFLIVGCERKNFVEDLGRALLAQARTLGVGDRVMRHSASLTELGNRGEWAKMRQELTATQGDVEAAMTELKDEQMAHLISFGGWLRGLEICSAAVEANYTPQRSGVLWQRDLIHYFLEELKTLPVPVAKLPLFTKIREGVAAITAILDKAPPENVSLEDIKAIHARASELNSALRDTD